MSAEPNLSLRAIEAADLPILLDWVHSEAEMVQWSGAIFLYPLDLDQLNDFFLADHKVEPGTVGRLEYAAIDNETGQVVGQAGFSRIWMHTQAAHLGPVVVNPDCRGRGIATEMLRQLLRIGFDDLNLHRIELVVFDFNEAAKSCYRRLGFQREGILRDVISVNGNRWSQHAMSLLKPEWQARS